MDKFLQLRYLLRPFAFFSLTLAFISLWVKKNPFIWGGFLVCSIIFGFFAGVVGYVGILAILVLGVLVWLLRHLEGWGRVVGVAVVFVFCLMMWFHFVPGFSNWKIADEVISPGAYPYALWLNFDKPIGPLFLLGFVIPTITGWGQWKKMLIKTLPILVIGVALLILLALKGNLVNWNPKFPKFAYFFLWANLFFVSIPEEVLLRGLLQRELCKVFRDKIWGQILSVVVVAALFAFLHVKWLRNPYYIFLVFIAGLFFGGVYQYTKSIESSIICHYLFNVTHFFFFSFPMLVS